MRAETKGRPAFGYVDVDLEPGEAIVAEADAMASMHADLDVRARLNGGLLPAVMKSTLGRETLFVNEFTNNTSEKRRLTLGQGTPGDIGYRELNGESFCLQPGAYIASTPEVHLGLKWAGFASFVGREGLVKLEASGTGVIWYGAYGGLVEKKLSGEYIVDTSHLVAYEPGIKLNVQMAGGFFSSIFGGEGLVTRLEGTGSYIIQTRSVPGLVSWLNPKIV